jgi:SPP1 gp7 family putative phage head morphogenesis protein
VKSEEYWARRMEDLNEAELRKGEAYIRTQNAEYDKAMARLSKETDAWYARLAKNNDVSMAGARKLLTANELKEFHWSVEDYIKAGRENAVDQRWVKELENASAKVHITRLEELQTKMRQEVELVTAKRLKGTTDVLSDIYKDGYYRGIHEVQRGVGVGVPFAGLDTKQIDKVLAKPWAPDGRNFSSRIWGDRDKLLSELQSVLTQDLIRGEPSEKVISDFAARMGVSKSAAERLIITEAAYFSGQSRIDGYKETGVKQYKFVATLDRRTSENCRQMDGEVIPLSEAKAGTNYPPLHARCRSTTIPHFEDVAEPGERAARSGEDGKTYSVPGNMTYEDWAAKYAPKDALKQPGGESPKPRTPLTPSKSSPPALEPATTVKKAEAAAKNYGFDEVDYGMLDLDSANAVNDAIDKAMREFPGLHGFARKISAVEDDTFVAQASITYDQDILSIELNVSATYFNESDIDDIIERAIAAKLWPEGSNKRSLLVHEFGHLAEYAHAFALTGVRPGIVVSVGDAHIIESRIQKGTLSAAIVSEALAELGIANLPDNIRDELSSYANAHSKETLAEAIAEAVGTDNPRRLARTILRILKRKMMEVGL